MVTMKSLIITFLFLIGPSIGFSQCSPVLDIDNTVGWGPGPLTVTGTDQWQSFTNLTTGKLTRLDLLIFEDPLNCTLSVYEGNGITGALLYSDDFSFTGTGWLEAHIPIIVAPNVSAGVQYTYRLESTVSFSIYVQDGDTYSGGVCSANGSGGVQLDNDMNFKTYIQNPLPVANISSITNISCFGSEDGSISTTVNLGQPQYTFLWLPSGQTTQNATDLLPGSHKFIVTDADGCVDSVFATINEPADILLDAGLDETICKGESLNLNATSPNADNFLWLNNTDLSSSIIPNPLATPISTTLYVVTVEDSEGCVKSDSVEIFVDQACFISFSNTISCNNDGVNDTWEIQGIESFPDNKVTIYNRWGDVIFEVENYDNTLVVWDGKLPNTLDAKPGTYFYNVTIKNGQTQNGWIELLR